MASAATYSMDDISFIRFDIIVTLDVRMSTLGLPEQHARYFPTESEAEILVPHLVDLSNTDVV
jgi:hypothetical protein